MNFFNLSAIFLFSFSVVLSSDLSRCPNFEHNIDQFKYYPEMKTQILKYLRGLSESENSRLDIDLKDKNGVTLLELAFIRHMNVLPKFWFFEKNLIATAVNEELVNTSYSLIVALLELGANPSEKGHFDESVLVCINKFIDELDGAEQFVYLRRDSYWRERLKKLRKTLEHYGR